MIQCRSFDTARLLQVLYLCRLPEDVGPIIPHNVACLSMRQYLHGHHLAYAT